MNISTLVAAFVATAHSSPLVAEYYTLGDAHVIRLAGEGGFSIDHPDLRSTLSFCRKSDALLTAAALVKEELDRKFKAQQEAPHDPDVDVEARDHGSVWLVEPKTREARSWISEHVSIDSQWWANALVVEHRYISRLLEGMSQDGLQVAA